jgi:hypothetical protein
MADCIHPITHSTAPVWDDVADPRMQTLDGLAAELHQVGEYVYWTDGGDFAVPIAAVWALAGVIAGRYPIRAD